MVQNTVAGFYRRQLTPQRWDDRSRPPPDPNIYTTIYSILVGLLIMEALALLSLARAAGGFVYWAEARW